MANKIPNSDILNNVYDSTLKSIKITGNSTYRLIKLEYDANDNPIYIGYNADENALDSDTDWEIYKITYDANDNPTKFKMATTSWDNRSSI